MTRKMMKITADDLFSYFPYFHIKTYRTLLRIFHFDGNEQEDAVPLTIIVKLALADWLSRNKLIKDDVMHIVLAFESRLNTFATSFASLNEADAKLSAAVFVIADSRFAFLRLEEDCQAYDIVNMVWLQSLPYTPLMHLSCNLVVLLLQLFARIEQVDKHEKEAKKKPMPKSSTLTKPAQNQKQLADEAWLSPLSHATVLLCLYVDTYGMEGLSWHPETVKQQVEEDFAVKLPQQNFDRLMAAITLCTTNYFFKRLSVFIELCNVLSGDDFNPNVFKPADCMDCAWGITEALLIAPPDEEEPFTDEIRYYLAEILKSEGFVQAPDILALALGGNRVDQVSQDFTDDPELWSAMYKTQKEKNQEVVDLLKSTLHNLLAQLEGLPLQNGSTKELVDKLRTNIRPQINNKKEL